MVDVDLDHGTTLNKKIRIAQLAQYNFIFGKHFKLCQRVRCIGIHVYATLLSYFFVIVQAVFVEKSWPLIFFIFFVV